MNTENKVLGVVIIDLVLYQVPRNINTCLQNIETSKTFRPGYEYFGFKYSTSMPDRFIRFLSSARLGWCASVFQA